MRVLKWVGMVVLTGLSASVLALTGLGAAYASAEPRDWPHGDSDLVDVDVHDIQVHDLVQDVNVFAPILSFNEVTDVLNDLDLDVLSD